MNANLVEIMVKLRESTVLADKCLDLLCAFGYGDVVQSMDLDVLIASLTESVIYAKKSLAIVECAVAEELEPSKVKVGQWREQWRAERYNNDGSTTATSWVDVAEDDDGECGDDEDDETDSERNRGDVSHPKRSPLDDTARNEAERIHKDTVKKFKRQLGLAGDSDIRTLRKDDDHKKLYDGEWDVSKGMRLTVTRKKGDSVHVVVPCKLEKNAKLHHFTNADGINMSAIYTEDEDGEFWVEEASCMLGDEGKMIAWWNELHGDKRK